MNMIQILKRSTVVLASLFAMVAIVGCSETAPDYTSVVDASGDAVKSIESSAEGGSYYLTMSTSGQWTAVSDSDWCYFPVNGDQTISGGSGSELEILLKENETNDARVANIIVTSGNSSYNIVVNQSAYDGYITLGAAYGEVTYDTADFSFVFDSNLTVSSVSSSASDWVSAIISGSTVVLDINENTFYYTRMAEITLASGDVTATYVLIQGSRDAATLSLSETSYTFSATAATDSDDYDFDITSNISGVSYVVTSDEDWCLVSVSGDTFTVKVSSDNETSSSRKATITVVASGSAAESVVESTTLTIVQECEGAPSLLLNSYTASVAAAAASTVDVLYTAEGEVSAFGNVDWITSTVAASGKVTTTVSANTSSDSREGVVTVVAQSGGKVTMQYITVTQAGLGELELTLSSTSVDVAAAAGSFTIAGYSSTVGATIEYLAPSASWCYGAAGSYSVDANTSLISRECSIGVKVTVGDEILVKFVTVTQKGADATI